MDLDAVADELFGLPPADFVAARDERAATARRAGERELAAAIKELRRPRVGAWLANLLVRERPDEVSELLAVGTELRQAQAHLAHEDLRRLSKERRRVVASLAADALELARDRGQSVSDAAARELEATLEAAMLDAGAAGQLEAGRLTVALGYAGLGWAGADGPLPAEAAVATGGATAEAGVATEDAALATPEAALATAEAALTEAERDLEEYRGRAQGARRERDRQHQQVADLEQRLSAARAGEQHAESELREAEDRLAEAERRARSLQDELELAKAGVLLH